MAETDSILELSVEALTASAFAAYGEVLENKSVERRRDFAMPFGQIDTGSQPRLWVNRLPGCRAASLKIDSMECHPRAPQTFIPMHPMPCLIVVALPGEGGQPSQSTLRAFVSKGGQGVCYRPSVWHYTFTSLGGPNEVVVILANSGHENDTIVAQLKRPARVNLKLRRTR
jgi:ureidoglycolate lyase